MRNKISLYIADQLVDIDEQSFILFNYTMEDLSNPTIVKNSFSRQITLRGTPNNNRLFGDVFRLDRKTLFGTGYAGVEFDATRKTPFKIYNEQGEIVESGYVKLDEVAKVGSMVEYKVTLYGGLGSFFYALMYNEDGSKKTLTDLRYLNLAGKYIHKPGDLSYYGGYEMIQQAWQYLQDPYMYEHEADSHDNMWCHIVNFAPCYNGMPDDFSADKAVCNKPYDNVPNYDYFDVDGHLTEFSFKSGASSLLMQMANTHSEWEMRDLRWYLQRPIFRIKALFDAICDTENNGGYDVRLHESFFNEENALFWHGWFTLPMIYSEDRYADDAIQKLLLQSHAPAEYIISYAKMFGLVFVADISKKTIQIMPRAEFYNGGSIIDLSARVAVDNITISPTIAQSRFYQYGSDAVGSWAEKYKEDYGRDYAIHRVDTGYDFNADTKIVTEGIVFKDAVDVEERSLLFFSNNLARDESGGKEEYFYLPKYESVKLQMWGYVNGEEEMREYEVKNPYEWKRFPFNENYPLSDLFPKVQFHDGKQKQIDGANVLLVFNGMKKTPTWNVYGSAVDLEYYLTDDTPDMQLLNEGVPCWNYSKKNSIVMTSLPSFRRSYAESVEGGEKILATYEWGEPLARGTNGTTLGSDSATIYNRYWKQYQRDRYDVDTIKMSCKVNLRGLPVNLSLMRNFFYYQGAIFVLNAIRNHSLTTLDNTECEFIKVQDIENYRS